jgi:hypothetical protein
MDTATVSRGAAPILSGASTTPPEVTQAVATELTAGRSVTADAPVAPVANNPAQSRPELSRRRLIDAQTNEVLYRMIDMRPRQVVRRVPGEALLRARAYARAIANGESVSDVSHQADLSA